MEPNFHALQLIAEIA